MESRHGRVWPRHYRTTLEPRAQAHSNSPVYEDFSSPSACPSRPSSFAFHEDILSPGNRQCPLPACSVVVTLSASHISFLVAIMTRRRRYATPSSPLPPPLFPAPSTRRPLLPVPPSMYESAKMRRVENRRQRKKFGHLCPQADT